MPYSLNNLLLTVIPLSLGNTLCYAYYTYLNNNQKTLKTMKKLLVLKPLMTLFMVLLSIGTNAEKIKIDAFYYNLDPETQMAEVTSGGSFYAGGWNIPKSVKYENVTYSVTTIGSYAFRDCVGLTSITLPNSVTTIDSYAFQGCSSLTSIEIPNSVTSIGIRAFEGCSSLTTIEIPNSVTYIGASAFALVYGLTSVTIPNSVTAIGYSAFSGCTNLASVVIPNSVTSIGSYAFSGCTNLTTLTIGEGVTGIGENAFKGCTNITTLYLNCKNIGNWFNGVKSNIHTIVLSEGVNGIEQSAFSGCGSLTSVTISNSVKTIGDYSFKGCSSLTSLYVPNSVTAIGNYAFENCTGLDIMTIPGNVTSIGEGAFKGCSDMITVEFNNGITLIGNSAFANCTALASLSIPNSVTSIGASAFSGCTGLTTLTIGDGLTTIGPKAFSGCTNLKSAKIQCDINVTDNNCFLDCTQLETIYVDNVEDVLTKFHILSAPAKKYYINGEQITEINVPEGTKSLARYALNNIADLKKVTLPASIESWDGSIDMSTVENIYCYATNPPQGYIFENTNGVLYVPYGTRQAYKSSDQWKKFPLIVEMPSGEEEEEVVITLEEAGTLKEALSEVEATKIKHLTLRGPIDANDIKLIRAQEGRLSTLEVLNLKDVTELVPKEKVYYYGFGQGFDGVLGGVAHYVCIGERDESVTEEYAYGTRANIYDYFDDLAYAFIDMPLKRIVWPSCLKEIGPAAMHNCKSLEEFIAPTNPEFIGGNAFSGCSELRKIPTLKDVKTMHVQAFEGCSLLTALDENQEIDLSSLDTIPENAFAYCNRIKNVKFSSNVHVIHTWAFYKCSGIESIVLPNSINILHDGAFDSCTSLTDVSIPSDFTNIKCNAFRNTPWYNNIEYVDGIKYINNVAMECIRGTSNLNFREGTINIADNFENGSSTLVTSISFPSTLQRIGSKAFASVGVTNIVLPTSLKTIGEGAFSKSSLTSIDLPESLEEIGVNAFQECSNLTKVNFSSSVKKIGQNAFYRCALETLTLPSTIEEIGDYAFSGNTSLLWINHNVPDAKGRWLFSSCTSLERVTFGEQVRIINWYSFDNCSNLMKVNLSEGLEEIESGAFCKCKSLKAIILPNTLKKIGEDIFRECPIESLSIPASIEEISHLFYTGSSTLKSVYYNAPNVKGGDGIFENCKALEQVTFGEQVRVIPSNTFRLCSALKDIILPEGLEEIGGNAFGYCTSLTSVTIPRSVTTIGSGAFDNCNITSVTINSDALVSKSYRDPDLSAGFVGLKMIFGKKVQEYILGQDVKSIGEMAFCYCGDALTSVVIPNGVTSIDHDAFAGCANLSYLTIPESVTTIGEGAFWNCKALTSITIPKNVETIGKAAFKECASLGSLIIENGVTTIGDNAFEKCIGLLSVVIPNSVTSLGKGAFYRCSSLTFVTIGTNVDIIDESTFWDCNSLTSVTIGNSVTAIDGNAFRSCNITSLTIPNSVTTIKDYAFYAGGLKSVIIGNGITYIGNRAFDNNYMTDVYCYSKDVPEAEYNAFATDVRKLESTTLHIPATSIEAYKAAVAWKDFGKIVALDDEISVLAGDANGDGDVNVFDVTATVNYILGTPYEGFVFEAADVNGDDVVNVFDVTKVVNIILGVDVAEAKRRGVMAMDDMGIMQVVVEGENQNLVVDKVDRYVAMQFDVLTPEGQSVEAVTLYNTADHILSYQQIDSNRCRVIAYSMENANFEPTKDALVSLMQVSNARIENAVFVTADGRCISMIEDGVSTNVEAITQIANSDAIYNLSGQYMGANMKELPKGVYIQNYKKFIVK